MTWGGCKGITFIYIFDWFITQILGNESQNKNMKYF